MRERINDKYYLTVQDKKTGEISFKECPDGEAYENELNIDLFKHKSPAGVVYSEGQTGLIVFRGRMSKKRLQEEMEKVGGIDGFNEYLGNAILKYGLTPRYKA